MLRDPNGTADGRSFDDSTWLRLDTTRPHSGRRCARVALPTGAPTLIRLPCERGDEHFTHQAKVAPPPPWPVLLPVNPPPPPHPRCPILPPWLRCRHRGVLPR